MGLIELAEERLVLQIVQLGELDEAIDGDDDPRAEVARVLATNELARVVGDEVERAGRGSRAHGHCGKPVPPPPE